jgi:hypothetical protein
MGWKETAIAVIAWITKVFVLVNGLILLLYPDFALYLRAIGFVATVIAVLSFRTTQQRLLTERGIRIPSLVVGVLLIGMVITAFLALPSAGDLEHTGERAELTDSEMTYEMNITNTGDGSVIATNITVYLNTTGETVAETQILESGRVGRGETRSFIARFQLGELAPRTRSNIESGRYEIYVLIDSLVGEISHTYSP